ncbi:MAG: hypothetical protein SCAL_001677 [Candidatus Syntrophoarchaeum caldarius]|uniref:Uncharacterized protein n=1 Tax=Candidatus Syntropharchaeum caldarium TaxID=1838285 RepID=A0A1F2P878_9EURY|nr:MAG: hypothetical protein SCAL_001677 [Candidatus Syntrophoarchaeum caldarius]
MGFDRGTKEDDQNRKDDCKLAEVDMVSEEWVWRELIGYGKESKR